MPFWLKSIIYGDARLGKAEELKTSYVKIATLARTVAAHIVYAGPPVLIHGDAINPSNVLVRGNKVTGLLDWEWSMIGDPAWEFCDCGWWPLLDEKSLRPYLKEAGFTGTQAKNFLKRARTYRLLWILWGAHMHAKEKRVALYRALRKMLTEEASAIRN